MNIQTSVDALNECTRLRGELNKLKYNPDLKKMLSNIEKMVIELSKKEVEARRLKRPQILDKQLTELNQAVSHLHQLILVAQIMN